MNNLITNANEFEFSEQQTIFIIELKKLVEESPKLKIGTEDKFLSKFLYFTNWNVEKALEAINNYYDFKITQQNGLWITKKCVDDFKDIILNTGARFLSPKFDKNGRYLCVYRLPNVFDRYPDIIDILTELDDLALETILATRRGQENGLCIIFDVHNLSARYIKFLKPKNLSIAKKKNATIPLKNRNIHVIQTGYLLNLAIDIVLPIFGEKMKKDTTFHKELISEKLTEMIGYDALPHEYGGPEENVLDANVLYNFLNENRDYVKKVQGYNKIE